MLGSLTSNSLSVDRLIFMIKVLTPFSYSKSRNYRGSMNQTLLLHGISTPHTFSFVVHEQDRGSQFFQSSRDIRRYISILAAQSMEDVKLNVNMCDLRREHRGACRWQSRSALRFHPVPMLA